MDSDVGSSLMIRALASVGALFLTYRVLRLVQFAASTFVLPGKNIKSFRRENSWAVVTGSSEGIGREYALQLAAAGFNVWLSARNRDLLKELAGEIEGKFPNVSTAVFPFDYSTRSSDLWASFEAEIARLDESGGVAVLVNNVGRSHSIPVPFAETEVGEMEQIIDINCHATLRVTRAVVPGMKSRRNGLILTMSSFASVFPSPLLATYTGSKSFLTAWAIALGSELEPFGITVNTVQSYLVTSKMSKVRRSTAMIPSPRQFVRAALGKIGRSGGSQGVPYSSTPFWSHALIEWPVAALVGRTSPVVVAVNKNFHVGIRDAALRKRKREEAKAVADKPLADATGVDRENVPPEVLRSRAAN